MSAASFGEAELTDWLRRFATVVDEQAEHLTELDSAIGDADHGTNLRRGMTAVVAVLDGDERPAGSAALLQKVGMTLVSTVGGSSGPLYGTFFLRLGKGLPEGGTADTAGLGAALRAGLEGVVARGKAEPGDKTMVDALQPAVDAFDSTGDDLVASTRAAADAAASGRDATEPLVARKGRASYLGERSAGHVDPGAASTALLLEALAGALADG